MDTTPLKVGVIIGSTREGRAGGDIGKWFLGQAVRRDDINVVVIDLVDFDFPPRYPSRATEQMSLFTSAVDKVDAYVVVTPEYNRSFPASLKQAIDFAYDEWRAKPVCFVSYGCGSDGVFAVEQLRTIFTELHTVSMRDTVSIDLTDGDAGERAAMAATVMLDQLTWWGHALREARAHQPYVC